MAIDVTKIPQGTELVAKLGNYTVDDLIGSFKDDIEYLVKGKNEKNEDKDFTLYICKTSERWQEDFNAIKLVNKVQPLKEFATFKSEGVHNEYQYMVFDNYPNDLRDMYKGREITPDEIRRVMQQLHNGLYHLDGAGIIHRDIQPRNLKIKHAGNFENFTLKIANFGSAVRYKTPIVDHHRVTLQYRSIELLFCTENPKPASDRWSAGCVMAELLKREPLFKASHQLEMIHKVFTLLGKPDKVWLEDKNLPLNSYICSDGYNEKPDFEKAIPRASKVEVGILSTLLTYNPEKRNSFTEEERKYLRTA